MKVGWKTMRLSDVAEVGAGNPAPQSKDLFVGGKYPFIRTSDVGKILFGEIGTAADMLNEKGKVGLRLVPSGTVLIPKSGASTFLNHRVITLCDAYISSHLATVTADRSLVEPRYLLYALHTVKAQSLLPENSYPSLNLSLIEEIRLPIPQLEEQARIVKVLDDAFLGLDRSCANVDANLNSVEELFLESVSALFRDPPGQKTVTTLGEIAGFRNGLNFSRASKGATVKIVGVGDFRNNFEVPTSSLSRITVDGQIAAEDLLIPGDIVAVRSNGNRNLIGRTMLLSEAPEPISFSGFTIRIRLETDQVIPSYLCAFMRTQEVRAKLTAGGGGANISNLNQRLLSSLPVVFPSISAQEDILARLTELTTGADHLREGYHANFRSVSQLRHLLLQRAFAGELI